jgi:hypothetical protein
VQSGLHQAVNTAVGRRKGVRLPNTVGRPRDRGFSLRGWQQIAAFLGQPISVAQGWAKSGMPVTHESRRVRALADELKCWLGHKFLNPFLVLNRPKAS